MKKKNVKGFTLIEMMVVIGIIAGIALLLVPSMVTYIKEAKRTAAIADARTVKTAIESSLIINLPKYNNNDAAFNKVLFFDLETKKDYKEREHEIVGAFSNLSFDLNRANAEKKIQTTGSQTIDLIICRAIDNSISEKWKTGKKMNPMGYNSDKKNCAKYLKDANTNFGLIVVYDSSGFVRMMQLYRKGILVTYIKGEYIVNSSPNAHFVGTATWDTIYADSEDGNGVEYAKVNLSNKQIGDNGKLGGWY